MKTIITFICMVSFVLGISAQDLYIRFNRVPTESELLTGSQSSTNAVGKPITIESGNPVDGYLMNAPTSGDIYSKTFTLPAGNYEYQVVFADGTGTQGEKSAWTVGRGFTVSEEKEVVFRAKVVGEYIRFLCDAQELYYSTSTSTDGAILLPEPDENGIAEFSFVYDQYKGSVQGCLFPKGNTTLFVADLLPSKGKYTFPGGANGKTRWLLSYNRHTLTLGTLKKVVTLLDTDLIDTGNGLVDAASVSPDLGVFSTSVPFLLAGGTTSVSARIGIDGPAGGEKDNNLLKIAPENITAKMYYTVTPSGSESEAFASPESIILSTEAESGVAAYETAWKSETPANISGSLSNGTYALTLWYETECFGDIVKSSEYTTSFTVNNISTGLETLSAKTTVSSANGVINASFEGQATIYLYTISGQLINKTVASDIYSTTVKQGIYILKINDKAYKVAVK